MLTATAIADFLTALSPQPARRTSELVVARRAMACEFSVAFPEGRPVSVDAGCAALDEVARLEGMLSAYLADSELSRLNRLAAHQPVEVSAELYHLLRYAARHSAATGGAFDAACGALVKAWGFFRGPRRVPSEGELATARTCSGWQNVRFDDARREIAFACPGLEFNLGGIGKGYAIDRALEVIRTRGIASALMQGGQSSLKGIGAPPGQPRGWAVAIGDPCRPGRTIARVYLRDRALGTSGAANQFFIYQGRRYSHVIDPRTGRPADGLLSASAIAHHAADADALSTAFFVLGAAETHRFCRAHPGVGAVLVAPGRIFVFGAVDAEVSSEPMD